MKKDKKLKIMEESICYLDGEQKVRIVHKKDEKYNYKKALKRTENPKFKKMINQLITKMIKEEKIVSHSRFSKLIKESKKGSIEIMSEDIVVKEAQDLEIILKDKIEEQNKLEEEVLSNIREDILIKSHRSDTDESIYDSENEDDFWENSYSD